MKKRTVSTTLPWISIIIFSITSLPFVGWAMKIDIPFVITTTSLELKVYIFDLTNKSAGTAFLAVDSALLIFSFFGIMEFIFPPSPKTPRRIDPNIVQGTHTSFIIPAEKSTPVNDDSPVVEIEKLVPNKNVGHCPTLTAWDNPSDHADFSDEKPSDFMNFIIDEFNNPVMLPI